MMKRATGGIVVLILLAATACTQDTPSVLRPRGFAAGQISGLWWLLFGLGAFVYVLVVGLVLFALLRRRKEHSQKGNDEQAGQRIIWAGGVIMPTVILLVIYGFTFSALNRLAVPDAGERLVVEVTGHQWWWEVRYPQYEVTTANEIVIPAGQEVAFQLASDDVIHSFWVPELHGKMDMIPGTTNHWQLQADEAGEYWGLCAEFCGTQHAKMLFLVIAVPDEQFETWINAQRAPAIAPETASQQAGQDLFMTSGCAQCHAIQGTGADGDLGPDLTHFAGRRMLGAGSVTNNRANLAGWVADPHGIKPGSLMPTAALTGPELLALVDYLESLE